MSAQRTAHPTPRPLARSVGHTTQPGHDGSPAPFVWLVAGIVPLDPSPPLPPAIAFGPGRAVIEQHPNTRGYAHVWTSAGETLRFPAAYRDEALDAWVGPGRGAVFHDAQTREDALFSCIDALCADLDPLTSGGGVEHDSPHTRLTLRDGVGWLNGHSQWPPFLPSLGAFFPQTQPQGLVESLGTSWQGHGMGLVLVEMPSHSAHHRLALRQRLAADLAAVDLWREGRPTPSSPLFPMDV